MATWQHLRSSTANKRPTTSLADGRIAINTNTASPGLFFKDSAGTGIVKVGPVHVGTTAPNSVPAAGGSSGNYTGEQWLDTSVSPAQMKVWNGSTWVGIVADELPVSKLQDGAARQLIQTDAAGTGVEWTSDVDVPGTLDVTSTATFDSIAQHPLGTAGAPTITFTGDNNTGIYSPGADQVAISTGGSGRLFVDASGRIIVGAATAAIGIPLEIVSNAPGLAVGVRGRSADNIGIIGFYPNNSSTEYARIQSNGDSSLSFGTGPSGSERLRITSAGLVGVGSSDPGSYSSSANQLVIAGSGDSGLTIRSGTANSGSIYFADGTAGTSLFQGIIYYSHASDSLNFHTNYAANSNPRMVIDSQGRVGVGTTPLFNLDVGGTGQVVHRVQSTSTSGVSLGSLIVAGGNGAVTYQVDVDGTGNNFGPGALIGTTTNHFTAFRTNNTERLRITSAGLVGIGTSAPFVQLTNVSSNGGLISSNSTGFAWQSTANDWAGAISSRPSSGNSYALRAHTEGTTASDYILFASSGSGTGTARFAVTGAGNVGIGTTSPGQSLSIVAPSNAQAVGIWNRASDNTYGGIYFKTSDGATDQSSILNERAGTNGASLLLYTKADGGSTTERARIDSSGRLLVGTSTGLGTNNSITIKGTAASNPSIYFARNANASSIVTDNVLGFFEFGSGDGGLGAEIRANADGAWSSTSDCPSRLVFSVTRDGQASPTGAVQINNTGRNAIYASATTLVSSSATGSGTAEYVFVGQHSATTFANGADCIRITTNGNVTNLNNSYGQISDQKLKENVVAANSQWSDVKAIQVKNFNFIGSTDRQIGVIAQEVEAVSPGLVDQSPDRDEDGNDLGTVTKSVKYSVLYMKAVKALQEAMERIETLEAKVAALESA